MKTNINSILCFIIVVQISCKSELTSVISYEEALKVCTPDTMKMFGLENDTTFIPYLPVNCIVGAQLPAFSGMTMDSVSIDSIYLENKVTVINFWFIGCQPCEAEMPGLNMLVLKYKDQPVNFLAISRNSPTHIEDFLITNPFNFDHIAYGEPIIVGNFKASWGYPLNIVADRNNKIVYANSGGKTDSTAVEEIQRQLIPVIDEALKGN